MARGLLRLLERYDDLIKAYPLRTKTVTSVVIFGACELNAQVIKAYSTPDPASCAAPPTPLAVLTSIRWGEVACFGCMGLYNAPVMHSFFQIVRTWPGPLRIAANALVVDPVNFMVAITWSSLSKGSSMQEALETVRPLSLGPQTVVFRAMKGGG